MIIIYLPESNTIPLWQSILLSRLAEEGLDYRVNIHGETKQTPAIQAFLFWAAIENLITKIPDYLAADSPFPNKITLTDINHSGNETRLWLGYSPPPPEFEGYFLIHDIFYTEKDQSPCLFHHEMPYIYSAVIYQQSSQGLFFVVSASNSYGGSRSLALNLHVALGKGIVLLLRTLRTSSPSPESSQNKSLSLEAVSSGYLWRSLPTLWNTRFLHFLNHRKKEKRWVLMYSHKETAIEDISLEQIKPVFPSLSSLNADPFLFDYEGKTYIFFETQQKEEANGSISVSEWKEGDTFTEPVVVLAAPFHLSFPFVFLYENNIYMMPETQGNRSVSLYEAVNFPFQWKLKKHLLENIETEDNVLFFHEEKWWLFTNTIDPVRPRFPENHGSLDELSIYFTDNLLHGTWKPHAKNPVLSGITKSRNGGKIFKENEKLIRVVQSGSPRYGYALILYEILTLTDTSFEQVHIRTIPPPPPFLGTHTLNFSGTKLIIDVLI